MMLRGPLVQIVKESIKVGREAEYEAIEHDTARACAELNCPHPHLALMLAIRPSWGMPATDWIEADPEFWANSSRSK
jgi:hypothetical protein